MLEIIHSFVNIFAGGRSFVKVYLFFIILTLFTTIILIVKNKINSPKEDSGSKQLFFLKFFIVSVAAGYILGFIYHIYLSISNGIPIFDLSVTFNNNEISSNSILHNHVLKGAFGIAIYEFGYHVFENTDIGGAFIGLLPQVLFWLGLLIVIASGYSGISLFYYFAKDFVKKHSVNIKNIFLVSVAFSMTFLALTKNIVDGGLFVAATLPILAILVFFVLSNVEKNTVHDKNKITMSIFAIWFVAWLCLFVLGAFRDTVSAFEYLKDGILAGSLIWFIFWVSFIKTHNFCHKLFSVIFIIFISFFVYIEAQKVFAYTKIKFDSGTIALYQNIEKEELDKQNKESLENKTTYRIITDLNFKKLGTIGDLNFFEFMTENNKEIAVSDLLKEFNLIESIYPVSVPFKTCLPNHAGIFYSFAVVANSRSDLKEDFKQSLESGLLVIDYEFAKISVLKREGFYVEITTPACIPRQTNLIHETLKQVFEEPIMIYNIKTK